MSDTTLLRIEPLAERHFAGLHQALDQVAREKRFLAFTQAPPFDEARAFYRDIVSGNLCQCIAVLGGEVVGWCDVLPVRGEARAHVGTLGIGLVPKARQRGIGARLLEQAIAGAWARGMARIELAVRADNLNAEALYRRFGFVPEGRQRHAYCIDGTYHDSLAMALLRPGL
ncbi:GNAT family N-acetyltransferase [Pseudorhodoferax soli]|uniref:Putative acetyltransferase n=1 Tax=Pseudorhodoferax soli TaxID=545864 RepID=A0A368XF07_9BURK|nr:GNAT family N-acetyltransferase [Pseudorhodoferax soli]RCW65608.1 putative acetyltransferase [Pseudorhodoferax soli]